MGSLTLAVLLRKLLFTVGPVHDATVLHSMLVTRLFGGINANSIGGLPNRLLSFHRIMTAALTSESM